MSKAHKRVSQHATKFAPVDLEALSDVGVDDWHNDFTWPVHYGEYLRIEQAVKKLFIQCMQDSTSPIGRDALLLNCKLFLVYSNVVTCIRIMRALSNKDLS